VVVDRQQAALPRVTYFLLVVQPTQAMVSLLMKRPIHVVVQDFLAAM
jgi:hypothetical protein